MVVVVVVGKAEGPNCLVMVVVDPAMDLRFSIFARGTEVAHSRRYVHISQIKY